MDYLLPVNTNKIIQVANKLRHSFGYTKVPNKLRHSVGMFSVIAHSLA